MTIPTQTIFVPILARPKAAALRQGFREEVRRRYLPARAWEDLPTGNCRATVTFYFRGTNMGDIDNLCKPVLDVIKGSLIRDDSQIKELHAYAKENSPYTGFEITLEPI